MKIITWESPRCEVFEIKIDDQDYDHLCQWRWRVSRGYAIRCEYINKHTRPTVWLHREVASRFLDISGYPEKVVDHINLDRLDNQRSNLRILSFRDNVTNKKMRKDNTTGFRGVSKRWDEPGIFLATIKIDGRYKTIGRFKNAEDAARAYDGWAKKAFGGTFNCFNFPQKDSGDSPQ